MKKGKEYELLIEQMYRSLEPNAIIKHDDHIFDRTAEIKRQIDVSIKYQFAGSNHLIIVQVKDYKTRASIGVVEEFIQVIRDVNANKGILICSSGFTRSAINKAKSYGIECLTVHSALKKNWETLVKIPVHNLVHDFNVDIEVMLNMAHKAGKTCTFVPQTFSYDKVNILTLPDLIVKEIIDKNDWEDIKTSGKFRIDLRQLGLYHSFDREMLPIEYGYVEIQFIKSYKQKFYIEPANYVYAVDHINKTDNLHNLTISKDTFQKIIENKIENDDTVKEEPMISGIRFNFNNGQGYHYQFKFTFKVNGYIEGEVFYKDGRVMLINENTKAIIDLETFLRSQQ